MPSLIKENLQPSYAILSLIYLAWTELCLFHEPALYCTNNVNKLQGRLRQVTAHPLLYHPRCLLPRISRLADAAIECMYTIRVALWPGFPIHDTLRDKFKWWLVVIGTTMTSDLSTDGNSGGLFFSIQENNKEGEGEKKRLKDKTGRRQGLSARGKMRNARRWSSCGRLPLKPACKLYVDRVWYGLGVIQNFLAEDTWFLAKFRKELKKEASRWVD